jgi:hypothetical protein
MKKARARRTTGKQERPLRGPAAWLIAVSGIDRDQFQVLQKRA